MSAMAKRRTQRGVRRRPADRAATSSRSRAIPARSGLIDDAALLTPPPGTNSCSRPMPSSAACISFPTIRPTPSRARRCGVNLSDLAAKGAKPAGFLLTLALPKDRRERVARALSRAGSVQDGEPFGCPLLGGDTVRTPGPVTISITAFGTCRKGTMVKRAGARAGDRIVVTGTIGDAALGLKLRTERGAAKRWKLDAGMRAISHRAISCREPRNARGRGALRRYANAAMDVSDGLAGDLGKLCAPRGVGADVEIAQVPLSKAARTALAADPDADRDRADRRRRFRGPCDGAARRARRVPCDGRARGRRAGHRDRPR